MKVSKETARLFVKLLEAVHEHLTTNRGIFVCHILNKLHGSHYDSPEREAVLALKDWIYDKLIPFGGTLECALSRGIFSHFTETGRAMRKFQKLYRLIGRGWVSPNNLRILWVEWMIVYWLKRAA